MVTRYGRTKNIVNRLLVYGRGHFDREWTFVRCRIVRRDNKEVCRVLLQARCDVTRRRVIKSGDRRTVSSGRDRKSVV